MIERMVNDIGRMVSMERARAVQQCLVSNAGGKNGFEVACIGISIEPLAMR